MTERALTSTSYLVLGLVRQLEPCTSYDMKQMVNMSIGMFWTFPHSQLYAEPARLSEEGYLVEDQETTGRRRRMFRITSSGSDALDAWLRDTSAPMGELRDEGVLRLFFADQADEETIANLATSRAELHESRAVYLTQLRDDLDADAAGTRLTTLELGLEWDRTAAVFWRNVAERPR